MAKRSINLTFSQEMADALESFVHENDFPSSQEAVRTILTQRFAATPEEGALRAAMSRPMNEMKHWALTRLLHFTHEMEAEVREAMKTAKLTATVCPMCGTVCATCRRKEDPC